MVHGGKQVLSGSDSSPPKIGQRNCSPAVPDSSPQAIKGTRGRLVLISATYFPVSNIHWYESQPGCAKCSGVSGSRVKGLWTQQMMV